MNQKINFPELVELLARKNNGSKREAENFLRELMSLMVDTISSGEQLRINGLGTFKPIWVEDRASVNVRTGEPYLIPGHYKLTFTPTKAVREAVNEPFSCFCVEVLPDDAPIIQAPNNADEIATDVDDDADDVQPIDVVNPSDNAVLPIVAEQPIDVVADDTSVAQEPIQEETVLEKEAREEPVAVVEEDETEITDKPQADVAEPSEEQPEEVEISDKPQADVADPSEEQPDEVEISDKPQADEGAAPLQSVDEMDVVNLPDETQEPSGTPDAESVPQPSEPISQPSEPQPATDLKAEPKPTHTRQTPIAQPPMQEYNKQPYYLQDEIQRRFSFKKFLVGLIAIVAVLLIVAGGAYYYVQYYNPDLLSELIPGKPRKQLEPTPSVSIATNDVVLPSDSVSLPVDTVAVTVATIDNDSVPTAADKPEVVTDVVRKGTFLTTMSLKHYGHKAFWVYIYEENKAQIPNPNNVAAGTVVVIPPAHKYGINANDTLSVAKALSIADGIKAKYDR